MNVSTKVLELLDKAHLVMDITQQFQQQQDPRIAYKMVEPPKDVAIYAIKVTRDSPIAKQLPAEQLPLTVFLGDKMQSTVEGFFLTFEGLEFDKGSNSVESVVSIAPKIHRIKTIKKAKLMVEYRNHTILETENVEEVNNIYLKLKERSTFLDQIKVQELRLEFDKI